MKIIKNIIDIDLKCKTGEHLIINGINGLADVIKRPEYEWFKGVLNEEILSDDEEKNSIFKTLVERGYIVENDYDESAERWAIIEQLKKNRQECINKCKSVSFVLTYGCNFACPYCYEKGIESRTVMTREQVDQIFAINDNSLEYIGLFGGEPLLLTNRSIIEYIISKAPTAKYNVITNGYYLEEYFDLLKKVEWTTIQVTFDGERDIHNKTRILRGGQETFDKIYAGIRLYAENKLPILIRMNVHPGNVESCMRLKTQIENEPWAQTIRFEMQEVFQVEGDNRKKISETLMEQDVKSAQKNEILQRQGSISNFLYSGQPLKPILRTCDADYTQIMYDPEGDVYACILSVGNKKKRVATYGDRMYYEENSLLKRDITTIPKCRECKYALFCGGGCPNAVPDELDIMRGSWENSHLYSHKKCRLCTADKR